VKIAHIFYDVNMSNAFNGLKKILNQELSETECAIFINKKWNALKLLTSQNTLLYHRDPHNRAIMPESIQYLPYCINGTELNYHKALEATLRKKFKNKYPKLLKE
jgi:hypothetical protein